MPTTAWTGNSQNTAGLDTVVITAAGATGDTVTATINGKTATYKQVAGDTAALVATGLYNALVAAQAVPIPEFNELTFANAVAATVTATEAVAGVLALNLGASSFTITSTGGITFTQTHTTAGTSQSDVNNAKNWVRAGAASLPVNGDDVVVGNSAVPLLYNLDKLAAVQFKSYTRYQSFVAQVGLPENNPAGYVEWRPTYFKFVGSASPITLFLGVGPSGTGPTGERYDLGSQQTVVDALAAGAPQAAFGYSLRFRGTNASNTISVTGISVAVDMLPSETGSVVASATVDGGGQLDCGPGVTFSGNFTLTSGVSNMGCAPAAVTANAGSTFTSFASGLTYASVVARDGSRVVWLTDSTVTALTLANASTFDKGLDLRAMTLTNATVDGTCSIVDPNNAITFTNAVTVNGSVTGGPFAFTSRTVKIV